jgi:hypothetical protein
MRFAQSIVIDLGDASEADVKALLEGRGALADDVKEAMRLVRRHATATKDSRTFVPVVAIYEADD